MLAYAHQGGAFEAPSSTLYAVEQALATGASGIELDVHATADGHLVVGHDATVDRTSNASGAIAAYSLAELRRLDNAYWWVPGTDVAPGLPDGAYPHRGKAPADRRFTVATLAEVLDLVDQHPDVALNLDIKATAPTVPPYEEALAKALLARRFTDRVIVASFLDAALDAFAVFAPSIATSAGPTATAAFHQAVRRQTSRPPMRHVALQVPVRFGETKVVDEAFVAAAHGDGLAVHVWTVNDEPEMQRLLDLGVDGIITDRPTPLVALLVGQGLAYRPPR